MSTITEKLKDRRVECVRTMVEVAETAVGENRDMTADEQSRYDRANAEVEQLDERLQHFADGEKRAKETEAAFAELRGGPPGSPGSGGSPEGRYGIADAVLRQHWDAISQGGTHAHRDEFRALVTAAADMGSPTTWSSSTPDIGLSLRAFSAIPTRQLDGLSAEHPSLTLPAGAAGVGESTAHGEFDAVAPSTLTASRFGRWSAVSPAVKAFDDIAALERAHRIGIARDLTLADVGAIQTAAGTPTVFSATTFEKDLRTALLTVAETVGADPSSLVAFGRAAALAAATGFDPTSGEDRGSVAMRVYGARIFSTAAAAVNQLTIFAPAAFLCFETGMSSATDLAPSTGQTTFGSWLHATQAGVAFVGGAKAVATA